MNKNFFRQYNKLILGSIILFFTALLFNHWTPYAADDYSYMFNLSDGSRMTPLGRFFRPWLYTIQSMATDALFPTFLLCFF